MQMFLSGDRDALFRSQEAGSDGSTLFLEIQEVKGTTFDNLCAFGNNVLLQCYKYM